MRVRARARTHQTFDKLDKSPKSFIGLDILVENDFDKPSTTSTSLRQINSRLVLILPKGESFNQTSSAGQNGGETGRRRHRLSG